MNGARDETILSAPRTQEDVRRERAVYYALVENLDTLVGRIIKALDKRGESERIPILFTSDQGLTMGSHGLMGKQNQYEHTANAPLIIAGPGVPRGNRFDTQCALRDLFPTVCEMTGLKIPASVQGRSLMPVLQGRHGEIHDAAYGYFTSTQRMLRTADGWKLIWYPQIKRVQLFDVGKDPQELHDLSAETAHQDRLKQMLRTLTAWLRDQGDPVTKE